MHVKPSKIVTLTSDFGTQGSYVGAMKGAVLTAYASAVPVDITHEVPPQNILAGARILASACIYYPPGTVHVAVIDPGVGTTRKPIVISAADQLFVGPDNGLLVPVVEQLGGGSAFVIEDPALMKHPVSATFHGRDIFAPVAGHLASGLDASKVGPVLETLVPAPLVPQCVVEESRVIGEVVAVDHFGNLITNIHASEVPTSNSNVQIAGRFVDRFVETYGQAENNKEIVALLGSDGLLEVAVPNGSAAVSLGVGIGTTVEVTS